MKIFNGLIDEIYSCNHCKKKYIYDEVSELVDFRCPNCGKLLLISVEGRNMSHILLERKLPKEILECDDVYLREDHSYHKVLGIKSMSKNRTKFGLKNFGSRIFEDDEFVNCLARMREE